MEDLNRMRLGILDAILEYVKQQMNRRRDDDRDRLTVIDDEIGAPTGADLLADVTAHMLRGVLLGHGKTVAGLYHVAAAGETSWHGYARFVIDCASKAGLPLKTLSDAVDPVPTSNFPTPAVRPHNSRLNTTKLHHAFGLHLPAWQQGVTRMLAEITCSPRI